MEPRRIIPRIVLLILVAALVAGITPVIQASGVISGYATLTDWDTVHESFSFTQAAVVTEGASDFFIADRGDDSTIHVFEGEAVIDMGRVPLDSIAEAPLSGYQVTVEPIVGHSYVMKSQGIYGKIQLITSVYSPSGRLYQFWWMYQPDGTRFFGGGGSVSTPAPTSAPTPTPIPTPTPAPSGYAADLVVTVGDMDNLGFGWPSGFDVFSGRSTSTHRYPYTPEADDPPGTDRIMLGTSYDGHPPAGKDGYTSTTSRPDNLPQAITLRYSVGGIQVNSAIIRMFVDDFQSPVWRSKFQATLNGQRAPFLEDILNSLRQTGPIGKLISAQVPDSYLSAVSSGSLELYIDDPTTGAGDGYAVDFVQLLINPRGADYTGAVSGNVYDSETGRSIAGATVTASGIVNTQTNSSGAYSLANVPAGLATVKASRAGYRSQTMSKDLPSGASITLDFELTEGVDPTITPGPTPSSTPYATPTLAPTLDLELDSVIQLTDFTDGNKREYGSISANGEMIVYRTFERNVPEDGYGTWTLWTTDTSGSKRQTKIFDVESRGSYYTLGSLGTTHALDSDARYAYFAVEKRETRRASAHEVNMGRVKLADNYFTPMDVGVSGYERVDVTSFRVTSSRIYCVVRLWEVAEGVDTRDWSDGKAIVRMDLDGSNQETLFIATNPGADNSPYSSETIHVDESESKLYYEAYGGWYSLDLASRNVAMLPESVQDYTIYGITQGKLIFYKASNVSVYDTDTGQLSEKVASGLMQERAVQNGIVYFSCFNGITYYCDGTFRISDLDGNTKQIIDKNSPHAATLLTWEFQHSAFSGDVVSADGKKILLTNYWDTGTKNYYILKLRQQEVPTPSSTPYGTPRPTVSPAPTPRPRYAMLVADSATVAAGDTVQVPVRLDNASSLASLGFNLHYDPAVVEAVDVVKGSLLQSFTFVPNANEPGIVRFGFASTAEQSGSGWAAVVEFRAVGAEGSRSDLTFTDVMAAGAAGATLDIRNEAGVITIGAPQDGDANGDGRLNEADVLHALRMYVMLEPENLTADMNGSGSVTPDDARIILQQAAQRRG